MKNPVLSTLIPGGSVPGNRKKVRKLLYLKVKTVMVLVLGALLACASLGHSNTEPTFQKVLVKYLNMGPAAYLELNIHGKSAATIDKGLFDIYRGNDFQPFWLDKGTPSYRGEVLFAALRDSHTHGLNPSDYLVSNIKQFWNSNDLSGRVKLDILMTLALIRYVADQREGRLNPRQIDPKLFATARDVEVEWKPVFEEAFASEDLITFLTDQAPPFLQYRLLRKTLAEYRRISAAGGWQPIPSGATIRPGMVDSRIIKIRERLASTGDLQEIEVNSEIFDQSLVEAVKKFQNRHNLAADGVVGRQTLASMNVPVEFRISQLIINMERYRWLKRLKNNRMVAVNIAGFEAFAVTQGKPEISMPVIVGKTYHATPVFNDTIKYIVFNPFWNMPPSIARNETLPRLQKDPDYLAKKNMRIFQGWQPGAVELDATTIDWSNVSKKQMNQYHIRQDPGPDNALGTLKIIFPNKYNVYLHDTPSHNLFKQANRAFSHGCIRMGNPAEMAAWVLGGEGRGRSVKRVNEIVATRKRQVVNLDEQIPVYILYRTAFVQPEESAVHFYNDIYGRDKLLRRALLGDNQ
jgi:murein L,D-transpeptidase YcbB/YkuD